MTLVGSEVPRIWTPPLRKLTARTSLGFEAIEFATDVLEIDLYPWQKWLLVHGLELDPSCTSADRDPLFRFDTVLVLVARQNGKTEILKVLALWKIYIDQRGGRVIATATDLALADKAWGQTVELVESIEDLGAEVADVRRGNSGKELILRDNGAYATKAASRRGARGFSGDQVLIDELREHLDWESWAASTKTTLARPRSQVWPFSNAGDVRSVVLGGLRLAALESANGVEPGEIEAFTKLFPVVVEDEDGEPDEVEVPDSLGLFEWSARPGLSLWDRDGWAAANPALGHGFMTERKIAAAARTEGKTAPWVFRTEVLCQWPAGVLTGIFAPGAWEACADEERQPEGVVTFAVDVTPDQSWAAIGGAFKRDGLVQCMVVAYHRGTGWVADRLVELRARWGEHGPVALCGKMAAALRADLEAADVEVQVLSLPDRVAACARMVEAVEGTPERVDEDGNPVAAMPPVLRHGAQAALTAAVGSAAWKSYEDGRVFDRRSSGDISPLYAVAGAVHMLGQSSPVVVPMVHAWPEELIGSGGGGWGGW